MITKWRTIAQVDGQQRGINEFYIYSKVFSLQKVAEELLGVFNEQKELFTVETSWDYWGDEESIFMEENTDLDEHEKPDEEDDPMVQMLTRLKINPEVIHYSAETNSFYD